ncbi:MAG: asparagine synthase (glutamine-hydrolyzing) [Chlorobium sp.]
MCGILGYSGHFDSDAMAWGLQAIAHRGPDDSGEYIDQTAGIGLGHVRLSIIDLSPLGHQPMASDGGQVVLVFNGEIYNFLDLRAELEGKGCVFCGHSDTEVLLNLYLAEGEAMLSRLNGVFAFAIWDSRSNDLLVARDGLGVKPLYYAALGERFAFASEIKGLLHLVPEACDLDEVALHRYLSYLWCPGEGTPLKAVRKLMPGEAMVVRSGRIERRWTWYQLPVFRQITPVCDEKTAVEGTVMNLRRAVQRQMVADVPVGAFLSGGLDSSAVVAFARELNPDIHCFTIEVLGSQEEGTADDLPYAQKVAKHLGVTLDVVKIDAKRMAGDLERMVQQLDEPLADPAPLNVLYISQLAREKGIKVLLSGAGGDDLFTGYRRHRAVQAERYWSWLPKSLRSGLMRGTSSLDQRNPLTRRLAKLFNGAALDGDDRLVNYFRWVKEADLSLLYTQEFRQALGDAVAATPMLDFLKPLSDSIVPLERMLALEQRFFLADHNLIYTDKMSMAAGVEVRVPFLDLDLVDFAARIPVGMKQRGKEGKWVLKKAMESYLPHEVIYRPKSGFGAPLRHWMRYELRELLGDLLSVDSLKRRGLFDPIAVQRLIAANDEGKVDASYTLLSLLCIEIWCRSYLDHKMMSCK